MIAERRKRKDLSNERIGDVRVKWLLKGHSNRSREVWLCLCLLCGSECRKNGHALLHYPDRQCCKRCGNRRRNAGSENEINYQPSMHEIWNVATKAIQSEWSPREERERRGVRSLVVEMRPMKAVIE